MGCLGTTIKYGLCQLNPAFGSLLRSPFQSPRSGVLTEANAKRIVRDHGSKGICQGITVINGKNCAVPVRSYQIVGSPNPVRTDDRKSCSQCLIHNDTPTIMF